MNLHEEIARKALELYKRSGCLEGRDFQNWLDAERIVLSRHASQDIEEPEGEESIAAEEGITEEVEGTEPMRTGQEGEGETTGTEEIEAREPLIPKKKARKSAEPAKKIMPEKKGASAIKTAAPKKIPRKKR